MKKIIKSNKHAFFLLALMVGLVIIFYSFFWNARSKNYNVDHWLGKEILFPKELKQLKDTVFYPLEVFLKANTNKNKIISIVDASCSKCIMGQLNKIDSAFNKILISDTNSVMVFVLNVPPLDSASFMLVLQPEIKAKGILLWDRNFNFERKNDIFTPELKFRTFMLNRENKIAYIGNPLFYSDILDRYRTKLKEDYPN